jgi:Putative metallopeptidase
MFAGSVQQPWVRGLLVATLGLVLVSGCGGGGSQEEEGNETAAAGQVTVLYEDDAIQPENQEAVEQIRESGVLEQLANWINERVALSHDMEVKVTDGVPEGVTDMVTQPDGRTIFVPGTWLTETHGIVAEMVEEINRPAVFPEEKFNADDLNVLTNQYIFGHEMGHALMRNLMLPITGFEEDSADGFASFYNVNEVGSDPVIAAAMFFDAFARQQGNPTMDQFASDHPITQQRVYNFLCLLEGSDPEKWQAPLVDEGYLPESRAPLCAEEWAWLNYGWWTVLEPHFSEGFSEQGTENQEQAREKYIAENEAFAEELTKIRTGKA